MARFYPTSRAQDEASNFLSLEARKQIQITASNVVDDFSRFDLLIDMKDFRGKVSRETINRIIEGAEPGCSTEVANELCAVIVKEKKPRVISLARAIIWGPKL